MKKLLSVLSVLTLITGFTFAGDNNNITAGFGVGFGGVYSNAAAELDVSPKEDADISFSGYDIIDIEGRLFLNNCNAAFLLRVNGSLAFFEDSHFNNCFITGRTFVGTYIGAGYRIRPTDRISLIPSAVFGTGILSAEDEAAGTETTLEYTSLDFGVDFAFLYQLSEKMHLEVSAMATVNALGTGTISVETGYYKSSYNIDGKAGKVTTTGKIGLVWLF